MTLKPTLISLAIATAFIATGCNESKTEKAPAKPAAAQQASANPTAADAKAFIDKAEKKLAELAVSASRAAWVQSNFITYDTNILAAKADEQYTAATVQLANEAAKFNDVDVDFDTRRKLDVLRTSLVLPAPNNPKDTARLSEISASLSAKYGSGKYCKPDGTCLTLPELGEIMSNSRDAAELEEVWNGWRQVSPPMRAEYQELVQIANNGAKELGFKDLGAMWRSNYDMDPNDFSNELDRLWGQVNPLYEALHCHVRAKLNEKYGDEVVKLDEPIPAHLLGNMWAQQWGNIYDLVGPADADPGFDLTKEIVKSGMDERELVKSAENFFTSLGFKPLPETFWERSLFTQPRDRDVVCHASAWNLDGKDDLRIKMCIQKTAEEFSTIHHELGHNFYQRAYNEQPYFYQNSANDGFHEAIGDTIALSVTPKYLKEIGLIDTIPDASADVGLLLRMALDKVAFLPFGLLVDQWRWQVFSGEIAPEAYNQGWWQLREKYQGIKAPNARSEDQFDPGAKYHVPGSTPYTRYFLAHIQQFQFHRALCELAGDKGPLHRCSIYNSKEAGAALDKMLQMGSSKPWPEAMKVLTGAPEMDATAILDYFKPLQAWLDEQNQGRQCGW